MSGSHKPQRGDEAQLFELYHAQLLRRVRHAVTASPDVIEDACAYAWAEFLRSQPERERGWRTWLFVTAQREAWRLNRERSQSLAIDDSATDAAARFVVAEPPDPRDQYEQKVELWAAMDLLAELPPRLRQIAFLRADGVRYSVIMEITGVSQSHLSHLVTRANDRIRRALEEVRHAEQGLPPRAQRLRELETAPPEWLLSAVGRPPWGRDRRQSFATQLLVWRRAALAIDDYRR
jgi:RNA polymerase sigma factor (sigma-70 family)